MAVGCNAWGAVDRCQRCGLHELSGYRYSSSSSDPGQVQDTMHQVRMVLMTCGGYGGQGQLHTCLVGQVDGHSSHRICREIDGRQIC